MDFSNLDESHEPGRFWTKIQVIKGKNKKTFNQVIQFVTFSSPNVGGHQQPLKGSRETHHPKKVTIAELPGTCPRKKQSPIFFVEQKLHPKNIRSLVTITCQQLFQKLLGAATVSGNHKYIQDEIFSGYGLGPAKNMITVDHFGH